MAWGIMMTAVTLLGMFGVAIFEATSADEQPSTKPDRKRDVAEKELKKVA